ncbi:VapE domain-containing protein [Flavobacterium sp.]|uniref:VapE domain-containing protein n=1 Tax=Flavobacterium sp. TaxID=239 RepID=UPI003753D464
MKSNTLSKDIILKHTNINAIYTKFIGSDSFLKGNISSPFSEDKKPSFKVYANGTFKCNSSTKQGDVWQFVAYLNNLDNNTQFIEVLQIIAKEMNIEYLINSESSSTVKKKTLQQNCNTVATNLINDYSITEVKPKVTVSDLNIETTSIEIPLQQNNNNIAIEPVAKKLSIAIRDFTPLDLEYWNKLGVDKTILEKYTVHSISNYCWTGKKPIYTKKESLAFAFELDKNFKLYIPNQLEVGIKKNVLPPFPKNLIFGLEQLSEKVENLIICEGEKDTIIAHSRGFNTITFGSGSIHSKKENIELLQLRCNNLFVCFDADDTGTIGMQNLTKLYPKILQLQLPKNENIKGYDITDYFQEHSAQDFQKIIDLAVKNKNVVEPTKENQITTIIHITEDYLNEHYNIRHNIIANEIEVSKKDLKEWTEINENSLWIEMQKKSIKVPASTLEKILKSDFVPKFNPLINYFENLPVWDQKTDYITLYADFIKLAPEEDKEQYNYHFKKWCVRAVKCATNDNYFNKNAFVISDEGKGQNIGKTTWIRFLCPQILSNYLKDDLPKDEKDAKIALTQNFIINLDELASLSRQEINTLKSLFSADKIKVRFPYDKKEIVVRRVANFIGSTNLTNFLHDETGSVRWLCFVADKIDFSYKTTFDINNLWAQAFYLSNDKNFDETITSQDMSINELRNAKFQMQSPEKDLICRFLEIPTTTEETKILTSTEIQHYLAGFAPSIKLNNFTIGKALTSLKYRKIRGATTTKYAVKYKDNID